MPGALPAPTGPVVEFSNLFGPPDPVYPPLTPDSPAGGEGQAFPWAGTLPEVSQKAGQPAALDFSQAGHPAEASGGGDGTDGPEENEGAIRSAAAAPGPALPPPLPAVRALRSAGLPGHRHGVPSAALSHGGLTVTPGALLPHPDADGTEEELPHEAQAVGLMLGGAGLMLAGLVLACRLPLLWLSLEGASVWEIQKTHAALLLQGTASVVLLALGLGAVLLRRWAPPLISAAGWLAVFTAALFLGIAGIFLGSDHAPELTGFHLAWLLGGLLAPLACLIYCEKESVTEACAQAQAGPSWTDRQTVPGLMVLWSGLGLALTAAALFFHQPALPLPDGKILTATPAAAAWGGLLAAGLLTAFCAWRRLSAANWILLAATLALAATLSTAGLRRGAAWADFLTGLGHPATVTAGAVSSADSGLLMAMAPWLAGFAPALLFLVLAMSRRAFSSFSHTP